MNVRGLFSNTKKRSDVFNWVKAKKISIVCFQETHSTKDLASKPFLNITLTPALLLSP
jgi:exonuclease III